MQDRRKSLPKVGANLFGIYLVAKMFVQLLPEYLAYYKSDFHPADYDYSQLIAYWKEKMAADYDMPAFQETSARFVTAESGSIKKRASGPFFYDKENKQNTAKILVTMPLKHKF